MAILLVFAMVMGAGCTESGTVSPPDNGEEPGEGENVVVKVGNVGPLTGGAATYGISVRNAVELAIKEANANEEIPGVTWNSLRKTVKGIGPRLPMLFLN